MSNIEAETVHVLPRNGQWVVMTDSREYIREGMATREEAIKLAGKVAADRHSSFLMIHSKDDLPDNQPH